MKRILLTLFIISSTLFAQSKSMIEIMKTIDLMSQYNTINDENETFLNNKIDCIHQNEDNFIICNKKYGSLKDLENKLKNNEKLIINE